MAPSSSLRHSRESQSARAGRAAPALRSRRHSGGGPARPALSFPSRSRRPRSRPAHRHGGNIGCAKLDARAERHAGFSSASDGTSRTRAGVVVPNARRASPRSGLEISRARTTPGTSPVRRTSVPGETIPRRSSRQRFFDGLFLKKPRRKALRLSSKSDAAVRDARTRDRSLAQP